MAMVNPESHRQGMGEDSSWPSSLEELRETYRLQADQTLAAIDQVLQRYGGNLPVYHKTDRSANGDRIDYRGTIHRFDIDLDDVGRLKSEKYVVIIDERKSSVDNIRIIIDYDADEEAAELIDDAYEINICSDGSIRLINNPPECFIMQDHVAFIEGNTEVFPGSWVRYDREGLVQASALLTGVYMLCQELSESNQIVII